MVRNIARVLVAIAAVLALVWIIAVALLTPSADAQLHRCLRTCPLGSNVSIEQRPFRGDLVCHCDRGADSFDIILPIER